MDNSATQVWLAAFCVPFFLRICRAFGTAGSVAARRYTWYPLRLTVLGHPPRSRLFAVPGRPLTFHGRSAILRVFRDIARIPCPHVLGGGNSKTIARRLHLSRMPLAACGFFSSFIWGYVCSRKDGLLDRLQKQIPNIVCLSSCRNVCLYALWMPSSEDDKVFGLSSGPLSLLVHFFSKSNPKIQKPVAQFYRHTHESDMLFRLLVVGLYMARTLCIVFIPKFKTTLEIQILSLTTFIG